MNRIFFIIALALSFSLSAQSDRVKTVETRDSASLVIFDSTGNNVDADDVQEAIEESNPIYTNHVFLSQDGDNATGVLGDPHRAFRDPWAAQDSLSGEGNISFLAYQGIYRITSGFSSYPRLTSIDTFNLFSFPGRSIFSAQNATVNAPLISDFEGSTSHPQYIYIETPESYWEQSSGLTSLQVMLACYNKETDLFWRAKRASVTGGRTWLAQLATKGAQVFIDSVNISGGIIVSIGYPVFTNPPSTIYTRRHIYEFGVVTTNDAGDVFANYRYQPDSSGPKEVNDSLSSFTIKVGEHYNNNAGILQFETIGGNEFDYSSFIFSAEYVENENSSSNELISFSSALPFTNSDFNVKVKRGRIKTDGVLLNSLELDGNTALNIDLGELYFERNSGTINVLNNVTLSDSAKIIINCNACYFKPNALPWSISGINAPEGTQIILKGNYYAPDRAGEIINLGSNTNLSGFSFQGAVFVNDGISEWIQASSTTTIENVTGVWSNSDSTINVNLVSAHLYGFNYPKNNNYYGLQTILDSIFISIPKQSATCYQETTRQYSFPNPGSVDTIVIDTLTNALITDSISQDTGYIRNISSDTMRWQVSYNLFKDGDEDPLFIFMDLTTDGSDSPEAIPGSRSTTEQTAISGIPAPGPTFLVDVPPGDAIRLCAYSISPATTLDLKDVTITVTEVYRE